MKEWNRLEDSLVTLSGGATGSASGNSETAPVITRTLPLVLNPVTGQYQGASVTITDSFRGSHTNSAGQKEGPMSLAGVNWTRQPRARAAAARSRQRQRHHRPLTVARGAASAAQPNVTFNPNGCAPGSTRHGHASPAPSPAPSAPARRPRCTQIVRFSFTAQIPAKHVFLAWAGQRVVLEHNWALDPGSLGTDQN
ncbi:MAG: hypothetical protein KatS3mg063_0583 [Tepidiforma sp.]|uniref:hypothetical protein n=1 Tax=Tepidiforma sp. TaxID=2682230 RepID=UPI0021DD7F6E|nr:hypothetical protein [Tepidiforma sp.]GIW14730.1 MAG: hypothetical protein KatS3mg063_0583 [Tepidiforma sp.]